MKPNEFDRLIDHIVGSLFKGAWRAVKLIVGLLFLLYLLFEDRELLVFLAIGVILYLGLILLLVPKKNKDEETEDVDKE